MTLPELYVTLLIAGTVLLASIAAARTAHRVGLPSLLLFLAVGIVAGEDGLGLRFDDVQLAQALGTAALAVILVEGGLTTRWSDVRRLVAPAGVLATVGVFLSVLVTASGAHWLLGLDWNVALLLGAIVSSTDSAAVFSVLRALPLPRKLTGLVEAESGFNDAPTIILVLVFSTTTSDVPAIGPLLGSLLFQLAVGGALGVLTGLLGAVALRHIALPATGLYPLATVGFGITAFARRRRGRRERHHRRLSVRTGPRQLPAAAPRRHPLLRAGRGLAGADRPVRHARTARRPQRAVQRGPARPRRRPGAAARRPPRVRTAVPAAVPHPWRQQAFISWAGLRGAVPIVLTTFPVVEDVPHAREILNIVFVLVALFTLLQGPTLPAVARRLGLVRTDALREIQVETAPSTSWTPTCSP